ncbi:hypothetical protein CS8_022300 [Cupriavidus sp. 8B]
MLVDRPPQQIGLAAQRREHLIEMPGAAWVHYATPRSHMLAMAEELFGLVQAGKMTSEPRQIYALEEAAEAHRMLESRLRVGATVLVP